MLILTLGGGLGNQMFQYSYARYLQVKFNEPIIYINDAEVIKEANRRYALDSLNIKNVKMIPRVIRKPINETERMIRKIIVHVIKSVKLNSSQQFKILNRLGIYYHEDVYKFYQSYNSLFPIKFIEGGFQSPKFFENLPGLKDELKVITNVQDQNKKLLKDILYNESVCVHIRRGDYLSDKYKNLNVCNYNYYLKAINYIIDNTMNPVFYIFSNSGEDIEWIKSNYLFPGNIRYVNNDNVDYEELRLMYSCKHFIISNSTFSWWAQFLSDRNGIVIAPEKWNRLDREGIEDLYLPGWFKIKV